MEHKINIGEYNIILEHDDYDDVINVDSLTTIDTSNIFGECVTISAASNRIGLLKSDLQAEMDANKLETRLLESKIKTNARKQAADNSGFFFMKTSDGEEVKVKATEKALENCFDNDSEWKELKQKYIQLEKSFNYVSSLYWSMQDKGRKLNGLVTATTPKEFVDELIEGKVNGILIKK